jgi:hypothetical protein
LHDSLSVLLGDDLSAGGSLLGSDWSLGVLSDLGVDLLVEGLEVGGLALGHGSFPALELLGVFIFVGLLEEFHVVLDVDSVDVVSVLLGVVDVGLGGLLGGCFSSLSSGGSSLLDVVAGESLGVMGNEDSSVNGALHGSEDSVSSGGSNETDIEESLERSSFLLDEVLLVEVEEFSISSLNSLVEGVHAEVSEQSSGEQETGRVGSGVVGKTTVEAESSELEGISLAEDSISLDGGEDDLGDDSLVGSSDNKSVLLGFVLVLVLLNKSSSGVVVSLSLSSSSEFDLESRVVGSCLDNFEETHIKY